MVLLLECNSSLAADGSHDDLPEKFKRCGFTKKIYKNCYMFRLHLCSRATSMNLNSNLFCLAFEVYNYNYANFTECSFRKSG